MTTPKLKTLSKPEWIKRLDEIQIQKIDLNRLVMNYLIIEGYKDAAEKFQQESGTDPSLDLNTISDRMAIRTAIQTGDIEQGIQRVTQLNPEILQRNTQLVFHLKQQQLIELIRKGLLSEAIQFAQEELAPRCEQEPQFFEELEKTMSLLAFEDQSIPLVRELLDPSHRQKTASELNAAILTSQSQERDPKLPTLLKMLKWSQSQLEERIRFPKINNLVSAELEEFKDQ